MHSVMAMVLPNTLANNTPQQVQTVTPTKSNNDNPMDLQSF